MGRRYALLEDNQRLLEDRIEALSRLLSRLVADRVAAMMIIGSVAEGRARDDSDVDVLLVLSRGLPRRSDYEWWEEHVSPRLPEEMQRPFPIQPLFVGRTALTTTEPHLKAALARGIPLWDPEGIFRDQSESRP